MPNINRKPFFINRRCRVLSFFFVVVVCFSQTRSWSVLIRFGSLPAREENVATFRGSEYFCYDLSQNPIQSSSDEITLSFKTWQRNGLILHTGKSADYVNLALKDGAVSLVINLGSGAFEAIVEPVNGKFNDNAWHDVKVTRNLRQVTLNRRRFCPRVRRSSGHLYLTLRYNLLSSLFTSTVYDFLD